MIVSLSDGDAVPFSRLRVEIPLTCYFVVCAGADAMLIECLRVIPT